MDQKSFLTALIERYSKVLSEIDQESIQKVIDYLSTLTQDTKVYLIGNGGSMAVAEHFAQDLLKRGYVAATALTSLSNMTAYSNDFQYSSGFSSQLRIYGQPMDCLICFSCSGESANILEAANVALDSGMTLITFTGCATFNQLRMRSLNNHIHIPEYDYGIIESVFSILTHYIVDNLK